MGRDVDYRAVNVPSDKDPAEFHYTERRSEILQLIEEAGHPRAISQTALADRYGVSQGQISQDVSRLREYIVEAIDTDTVDAITETVYQKSIRELMENGDYKDAVNAVESWNKWLFNRGKVEKEPDRVEADVTTREAGNATDEYELIPDDEDDAVTAGSPDSSEANAEATEEPGPGPGTE